MRTIYRNGIVYTGELPFVEAFAVENGVFTFTGSNAEANALTQTEDTVIDLEGAFVCASFNDSHMHILSYGRALSAAKLNEHTHSLAGLLEYLKEYALEQDFTKKEWLIGRGWNHDYFEDERRMPTRCDLDTVTTEHPMCLIRTCGHCLVANSKALELLGITGATPQPDGGAIGMENGEPNGLFFDNAMDIVYQGIPTPGREELKDMLRRAFKACNSYGVTSCQSDDYCVFHKLDWREINAAYEELQAENGMTVRVYEQANFTKLEKLQEFLDEGWRTGVQKGLFTMGPLKMLGDGALGARTALLSRPYADDPSTQGLSVFSRDYLTQMVELAHKNGMQIAVHSIGDGCLDNILYAYEKALEKYPREDHRHGVVHCQITRPEQLDKMAELGLHIYAQSIFIDYDTRIVYQRVGKELADSSYAWKTLMKKGVWVSNGTDCPVELPDAMKCIQCGVTRQPIDKSEPAYRPDEAFTVQEAIDSYTWKSAHASFEENTKGKIQKGMVADFVVLGGNPFDTDPYKLHEIPVLKTFLNGECVFSK